MRLVGRAYSTIFREEMGEGARSFLSSLSYVVAGTGVAALLTFAYGVLGGRILGPTEYGKFSLVQSAADFSSIPMLLGFGVSMVRFASEKLDADRQREIVRTSCTLIALSTTISFVVFFALSGRLSTILSISPSLMFSGVALAGVTVFYNTGLSIQRSLNRMRSYALFQPVFGVILLGGFLLFVAGHTLSFKAMFYSSLLAYGATGAMVLVFVGRQYVGFGLDREWVARLTGYSFFVVISGLSSSLYTNLGKVLIGRYMSVSDVGVYSAYFSPSLNLATIFFITFNVVFFPAASRHSDKAGVFAKINRSVPYLLALGIPSVLLFEFLVLRLYGGEYPINFVLMLFFAVTSTLIIWYNVCAATFNSQGLQGVRMTTMSVMVVAAVDIIVSFVGIPRIGLFGAIGGIGLGFASGILVLNLLRSRLVS